MNGKVLIAALSLLVSLPVVTADAQEQMPEACTQMACLDGLMLDFAPDRAWPAGNYRFDFVLDGQTTTCTGRLPLPSCETSGLSCQGPAAEQIMITQAGCALPADAHGFGFIQIQGAPKLVSLNFSRNGIPFINRQLSPEYSNLSPNGPRCGPVCHSATVKLD